MCRITVRTDKANTFLSVIIDVNLYATDGFDAHPSHLRQSAAVRAAGLVRGAMLFRQQLRAGQLGPDAAKGNPLCMDTYRYIHFIGVLWSTLTTPRQVDG